MSHRLWTSAPLTLFDDTAGSTGLESASRTPKPRRLADLLPRVLSSLVLMGAAGVSVWQGGTAFAFIWLIAACAVAYEWQCLVGGENQAARVIVAILALLCIAQTSGPDGLGAPAAFILMGGALAAVLAGERHRAWAFAGVAYAGALTASVGTLFYSDSYGALALLWLFATVWGTDVFAYFGGRLIGGPKLWPRLSPSKTWSGTLVGICAGASLGVIIAAAGQGNFQSSLPIFALGAVTSLVSQAGDLFESCVKRYFGVKDSSLLIPGHGGFMDRLDGFVAAASFATLFGCARGLSSVAEGLFVWF
jgi:phosphatidate cytidylyltransferase